MYLCCCRPNASHEVVQIPPSYDLVCEPSRKGEVRFQSIHITPWVRQAWTTEGLWFPKRRSRGRVKPKCPRPRTCDISWNQFWSGRSSARRNLLRSLTGVTRSVNPLRIHPTMSIILIHMGQPGARSKWLFVTAKWGWFSHPHISTSVGVCKLTDQKGCQYNTHNMAVYNELLALKTRSWTLG